MSTRKRRHWLLALREDLGVSQREMADQLGVTRVRISQIEGGDGALSRERLAAVWERHGRRLRRMGYTVESVLTA